MKNTKRIFTLLLTLCMILTMLPVLSIDAEAKSKATTPKNITEKTVLARINALTQLVNGKYFTVNQSACKSKRESGHGCDNCGIVNIINKADWLEDLTDFVPASVDYMPKVYWKNTTLTRGKSCNGFACYAGWYVFAQKETDKVSFEKVSTVSFNKKSMQANALPGDLLRLGGSHSAMLVSINDNSITVLDSNWKSMGKNCVSGKHTIFYSTYSEVTIARAKNYIKCDHPSYDKYGLCTECREPDITKCVCTGIACPTQVHYVTTGKYSTVVLRSTPYNIPDVVQDDNICAIEPYQNIAYAHVTSIVQNADGEQWCAVDKYMTKDCVLHTGSFYIWPASLTGVGDLTQTGLIMANITAPADGKTVTANTKFSIEGKLVSLAGFQNVSLMICSLATGEAYTSKSYVPTGTTFSLKDSALTKNLNYSAVAPGGCVLQITVTDVPGNVKTFTKVFNAVSAESTLPQLTVKKSETNLENGKRLTFTAYNGSKTATDAVISYSYENENEDLVTKESKNGVISLDVTTSGSVTVTASGKKYRSAIKAFSYNVDETSVPVIGEPEETDEGSLVTITDTDAEAVIYYTVGSGEEQKYERPFIVEEDALVTARAVHLGCSQSGSTSRFVEAATAKAPVISADTCVTACGNSVTLSWKPVHGAEEYKVWVKAPGNEAAELYTVTEAACTCIPLEKVGVYTVSVETEAFGEALTSNAISLEAKADCTVNFYDIENHLMCTKTVRWNGNAAAPDAPVLRGYAFSGWEDSYRLVGVKEDLDIHARYTKLSYKVRFFGFDGSLINTRYVSFNDPAYDAARPEPSPGTSAQGCVFAGWTVSKADEGSTGDLMHVDSNMDLQAVQIWADEYNTVAIDNVTAVRDTENETYTVTAQIAGNNEAVGAALMRVTLENAGGQMLRTGSREFSIPANVTQEVSVTLKYDDPASVAKVYVLGLDSDGRTTGTLAEARSANVTQNAGTAWGPWSDWTACGETPVGSDTVQVETKTQYRSAEKETATGLSETMGGDEWTSSGSYVEWSGVWSDWGTAVPTATETLMVEERDVAAVTKTQYYYFRYVGIKSGTTNTKWNHFCPNTSMLKPGTAKLEYVWKDKKLDRVTSWGSQSCSCHGSHYKYSIGGNSYYAPVKNQKTRTVVVTPAHTEYRTQSGTKYYTFWKWGDWSAWQDSPITATDELNVDTQTLYRSRSQVTITGSVTAEDEKATSAQTQSVQGNLGISSDFDGREATVMVYNVKNSDPNESQIQYVGQTEIGENNSFSFEFIPKEDPSVETGDFVVSLAVEGASGLINVATIEAPKPTYTVRFIGFEQTPLSEQDVEEGSFATYPTEVPEIEGYRFGGWSAPVTGVSRDVTISAVYIPIDYAVAFVDHVNQTTALSTAPAGTVLSLPPVPVAEGYNFLGWIVGDDTYSPVYSADNGEFSGWTVDGETSANGITVSGNTLVTAAWEKKLFTVQFLGVDGTVINTQQVRYGEAAVLPAPLTAEDREFLGWSTDEPWWCVTEDLVISEGTVEEISEDGETITTTGVNNRAVKPLFSCLYNEEAPESSLGDVAEGRDLVLSLMAEAGSSIYYTTDGSVPRPEGMVIDPSMTEEEVAEVLAELEEGESVTYLYDPDSAIPLPDEDCEIRAIAVRENRNDSDVMDFLFIYNEDETEEEDGEVVVISEMEVLAQTGAELPLTVRIENNPGLLSYAFLIECDRSLICLDYDSATDSYDCTPGEVSSGGSIMVAPCEEGYRVFWFSPAETNANGSMFTLTLKVLDDEEASSGGLPPVLNRMTTVRLSYYPENTVAADMSLVEMENLALGALFGNGTKMLGDVNLDGRVTAADVLLIAKYLLYQASFNADQTKLADVTGDGDIDMTDVVRLAKYIVGSAVLG